MSVVTGLGHRELRRLSSPVLVGRDHEFELLVGAAIGPPAIVTVEGDAGVGKTRLVTEVLARPELRGRLSLIGRCHRLREPCSFGPLIDALSTARPDLSVSPLNPVIGALRPLLPELADRLPPVPAVLGDPRAERHRSCRALLELLRALGPAVLVVEDLHWADAGTVELLQSLVDQMPPRLAVLVTYRRAELAASSPVLGLTGRAGGATSTAMVSLGPLDRDEVRRLTRESLGADRVGEHLADRLTELTGGNPFALEELIRLLHARDQLFVGPDGATTATLDALAVPPALRDSILRRAGLLARDARTITKAAAVLELPAPQQLLIRTAGLSPARGIAGLCDALSSALVHEIEPGRYALCHVLAGQAVYQAISTPERRQLHGRAAKALEDRAGPLPYAQLAHHFRQAGRTRHWVRCAERAADAAAAMGDDRCAAAILEQALSATEIASATRIRMTLKLGDAALFARVPEYAIATLGRALEQHALPNGVRGELRFCLSRLMYLAGDGSSAYDEMVRAAHELKRRPRLSARALANLAGVLPVTGDERENLVWARRAVQAGENQDDPAVTVDVLGSRAVSLLEFGDPAGWGAADDMPWNAGSVQEKLELVRACKYLANASLLLGHYGRAEGFLGRADDLRRELAHARFGMGLATARAHLQWRTGHWDGLEAQARTLIASSAQGCAFAGPSALILAWLLLSRGEVENAERRFAEALDVLENTRDRSLFSSAASGLARIHLARGDAHTAANMAAMGLRAAGEPAGPVTWTHPVAAVAVEALLALGALNEARALTARLARGLRGRDAPAATSALAVCRGMVAEAEGRRDVAARRFLDAERAWWQLPCPYEAAQALERRGRCLLAAGERSGGECLLGALEAYDRLGAGWDAARSRAALRIHRIPLPHPWRGGRRGYGQELSPREQEVAHLAGLGRTNREIAEALFISSRTVENHVASAMRKRAVASRRQLRSEVPDSPAS